MDKKLKPPNAVAEILRSGLARKKANNPGYSLRALARDLKVSPAFVSNMLSGKRLPPKERLEKLFFVLELDVHERDAIIKAAVQEVFGVKSIQGLDTGKTKGFKNRKTNEAESKNILASWLNLALLEGLSLKEPFNELENLRERLGATVPQFEAAIQTLQGAGLIHEVNGEWQKKDQHLYVAGGRSRKEVRAFHDMMITKARLELTSRTSDEDYRRRMINGFTIAVNPENLERVKAKIVEFMDELSQEAGEGDCVDVYQCNVQFFPLTKKI